MKLKKNKTKSKVKKYDFGGDRGDGATEMGNSNLSQDWGNAQTAQQSQGLSKGAQTGINMASAFASRIPQMTATYQNPNADAGDKTGVTLNAAADAGIGAIPGFGAFYGAARGATSMGQNAMPGTTYYDKKTGKNIEIKDKPGYRALNHILEPDHSKMISDFSNAARVKDPKDKAAYVGMGFWNLMGAGNIVEPIMNATGKSMYDGLRDLRKPSMMGIEQENSKFPTVNPNMPDQAKNGLRSMSKYANGGDGQLEHYNTGLHSNMNPDFANAQLDGKPIQLQRKEAIFRKKNGGDYVFTDNLMNPETGNLISDDAKIIDKKVQKPFYDEASLKTKNFKMEKLANLNDKIRGEVEQKKNGGELPTHALDGLNGEELIFQDNGNNIGTVQPHFNNGYWKQNSTVNSALYPNNLHQKPPFKYDGPTGPTSSTFLQQPPGTFSSDNAVTLGANVGAQTSVDKKTHKKDNSNNLTTGDYIQMAGSAVAPIANIANYFRKPEKVKGYFDRSQITPTQQDINLNPVYLAENVGRAGINEGSTSDAVRRANLANLVSGTQQNIGNTLLQNKALNNTLRGQYEDKVAGRTRFNSTVATDRDTKQSQTNAVRQSYLNTGLGQLGQSAVDFGKMKNQGKTNEIEYSTLQNLAANYGLDPKEYSDFLKSKGVKIKYK